MGVSAVVLAGGKGKRMQSEVPKQFLLLDGKPVLYYSLMAFEKSRVDSVVLVCAPGQEEYCRREIVDRFGFTKVIGVVPGGAQRYDSVFCALRFLKETQEPEFVMIHDGARPLLLADSVNHLMESMRDYEACVLGAPVKDTIQITDATGAVSLTPKRENLWAAQTPQCFSFSLVYDAYVAMNEEGYTEATDDAMVVVRYSNTQVQMVFGSYSNIKITTPEDLAIAEALLRIRKEELGLRGK